ncbi:MAG: helix-turn-helix domain-containing protein [Gammaproteobacteria bacterium]|nr:helix-turn-helix domain-containing protein [Gammaproteobacteria bacterium]MCW8911376.1 helix-turn-helix domain-containing protein [Gammaproteobacteria bacterium]MCW9004107.1 helix-turn-helix domain-containing protein [Gammaproteobacteria bacterium]MCW9055758.1 helix-turn-helix domain-containing protein [Gammaproteobacteria bacterium]
MTNNKEHDKAEVECPSCGLYNLCQLAGLGDANTQVLDSVVNRRKKISKNQILFDANEKFRGIFAVKSGAFKTITHSTDETAQILDFNIPGELIGLDALNAETYLHRVIASENSSICEMDLEVLKKLDDKFIDFQSSLILALANKVRLEQHQSLLISAKSAEHRLAIFLIGLSSRFQQHGLPATQFKLPISRKDIANYLGMAAETVARTFKAIEDKGLIESHARNVKLVKIEELSKLAGTN